MTSQTRFGIHTGITLPSSIFKANTMNLLNISAEIRSGTKKQRNMDLGSKMTSEKKSPSKPIYVLHKLTEDSMIGSPTTLHWRK